MTKSKKLNTLKCLKNNNSNKIKKCYIKVSMLAIK